MKRIVFLSGPMRGISRAEGIAWREKAKKLLEVHFRVLHAYRGREKKETFPDPKGAVIRDKDDIRRASILLVNDTLPNASMIGTAMEVFYAYQLEKIIIIFGNAHLNDYWLNYHSHVRLSSLEEACHLINSLFCE
ncbi:MAG: hypothetical protein WC596_03935 [Candidatus Shapirobacteria bacterium]